MRRRDAIRGTLAATGSLALLSACRTAARPPQTTATAPTQPNAELRRLADVALDAARAAGASYADVRISTHRNQSLGTREARVTTVDDSTSYGFGVRVLVAGTWGFAASPAVEREELASVARKAVALAKANSKLQKEPVELAPVGTHIAVWNTPIVQDAFEVPLEQKVERLLSLNALALKQPGVSFVTSWMLFAREHKFFASTEGSYIEQTLHRLAPGFTVTSVDQKRNSFQSRDTYASPMGRGYEYVSDYPFEEDVRQAAQDVVAKHSAPSVEEGPRDLILDPSHLWLTIHESIGHPTELDRAMGLEANFAGTSFLTTDKLGKEQVGGPLVNFEAEKTAPGSLASCGYDDDGAKTLAWPIITAGKFVNYQITRDQAHWIGQDRGFACSYAQSWRDVPFQRMPNVNLLPSQQDVGLADLIADTEDAIVIKGRGSFSIDHQRYNFQFGGQTCWQVKKGKLVGMLKDVAYQSRTPEFWHACDAIGGARDYAVGGSFHDGKGEPAQMNSVSHGCPPARFRGIHVLNTSRAV